ncbi:MYND-type domain-containing protein [Mycena venus]|uniref:MYND-type domain-containing protein n=1 Tax=Mycena venus TaxID=2733690 RepID=A0A8H7CVI7_9AGAR|nr:MYND-type domain-containing protein [Mycena venus]
MNGSSKDIAKLYTVTQSLTDDEAIGLLPVFYANLDPSWIPSLDVLDNITDPSTRLRCIENVTKIFSSLCYIVRNPLFPLDATPDLWPRIWKWMEFLRLYHECVPASTASEVVSTHVSQSQILLKFGQHPQTCLAMFSTKGVRRTLATAWATLVHRLYTADEPATLGVIAFPLLALSDMKDPQNLVEVVDGCGGSYKALALTLMLNISQAVANSKSDMAVTSITPVLCFLSDVSRISPEFVAYLLSHGIISSLVSALDIDGVPPPAEGVPDRPVEVELCLRSLIRYLNVSPGYPWTV